MGFRKALGRAEIPKAVAIESGKSLSGAKPEKTTRIRNDSVDGIVRKAIRRCVDLDREALCIG
jgi:hypothetical protein